MKTKFSVVAVLLAAVFLLTGLRAEAADYKVDWNRQSITAIGKGFPPPWAVGEHARMLAREAAIAGAQAQLAAAVQGIQVDATTTVESMMLRSQIINTRVAAVLRGATVIDEQVLKDNGYSVTMELPIFGRGSLASAVIERPAQIEPLPEPQPSTSITINVNGGYTGVIIDCRGFNVNPVMSPVITNTDGKLLYASKNLDSARIIREGMASYASNMSEATRAGSNPLVIKAVRMEGFDSDPVISVNDGNVMLSENKATSFLDNTAVVFLY